MKVSAFFMNAIDKFLTSDFGLILEGSWLCDVLQVTWAHMERARVEREEKQAQDLVARMNQKHSLVYQQLGLPKARKHKLPSFREIMALTFAAFLFFFMLTPLRARREPFGITQGQALLGGVLAIVGINIALLAVYRKTRRH